MGRGDRCNVKTRSCPNKNSKFGKTISKGTGHGSSHHHKAAAAKKHEMKKITSEKLNLISDANLKSQKHIQMIQVEDEFSNSTPLEEFHSPSTLSSLRMHGLTVQSLTSSLHKIPIEEQQLKVKKSRAFQPSINPLTNPAMRPPAQYNGFHEVPCVYPTEAEFQDPYAFFTMLHKQGYHHHGLIKIIPPQSWKPEYTFDKIKLKVNTRTQILAELSQAQPFSQTNEACTYKQFKNMADEFKKKYKYQIQTNYLNEYRRNEYEFWEHVEHPELFKGDLEVEYAADLPSKKYGSAFSFMNNMNKSAFNLNNINSIKNSLFQHFTKEQNGISGISNPWIYLGMLFACFCWHVEDLYMCALNYLHVGEAKTWYGIPPAYKYKFEELYKETYPEIFKKKPDVLFHLNLMISPALAAQSGIPVYRTEQKPGEFIFTFPKTYHAGFSHGFNCGEAVNVITFEWFEYYQEAVKYYQTIKHPTKNYFKSASFAIEWLISQVIYNLNTTDYDLNTLIKIKEEWKIIVGQEKKQRKNIMEKYGKELKEFEFNNKDQRYDRHVCWLCGYYTFYSYLFCNHCIKKSCLGHDQPCKCKKTPQLFLRFTDEDFNEQEKIIDKKIAEFKS